MQKRSGEGECPRALKRRRRFFSDFLEYDKANTNNTNRQVGTKNLHQIAQYPPTHTCP